MKRAIAAACIAVVVLALSMAPASAATIMLKDSADVVSAVVRIEDVADIIGDDRSERLERLRAVIVCSAPPPAQSEILPANMIASALVASGIDLSGLKLGGHAHVFVRREHDSISVEELSRLFASHVSGRTGWLVDSFIVKPPKNLQSIAVPVGEREIAVKTQPHEDFRGSVPAHFQITIEGKAYRTLAHRFIIERYVEALAAARKIPRGKAITRDDVETTKVEQSKVDEGSLTRIDQAVGLQATRTIQAGKVLSARLLAVAPIVRKGELKSVVRGGSGFRIMTKGRVLENGGANDIVRVRLPSRRIIRAMVVDSRTLRIVRQGE